LDQCGCSELEAFIPCSLWVGGEATLLSRRKRLRCDQQHLSRGVRVSTLTFLVLWSGLHPTESQKVSVVLPFETPNQLGVLRWLLVETSSKAGARHGPACHVWLYFQPPTAGGTEGHERLLWTFRLSKLQNVCFLAAQPSLSCLSSRHFSYTFSSSK